MIVNKIETGDVPLLSIQMEEETAVNMTAEQLREFGTVCASQQPQTHALTTCSREYGCSQLELEICRGLVTKMRGSLEAKINEKEQQLTIAVLALRSTDTRRNGIF